MPPFLVFHYSTLGSQVLELRKGSIAQARSNFQASQRIAPYMFESFFNGGEGGVNL